MPSFTTAIFLKLNLPIKNIYIGKGDIKFPDPKIIPHKRHIR